MTKKKKNHHSALKFKQNIFCRKKINNSSCDYINENKSLETRKAYAILKRFTCIDIEFLKLN